MEKITSFTIDHIRLVPGVYVSRKDPIGNEIITTFDLRMTSPNDEPVMNTAEMHAIEHLAATFLRNHPVFGNKIIYFGPMGCRTGFYLLLAGDYCSEDIIELLKELFTFIAEFNDEIPGASAKDCGNYLDMNLPMARYLAKKYLNDVLLDIKKNQLYYPDEKEVPTGTSFIVLKLLFLYMKRLRSHPFQPTYITGSPTAPWNLYVKSYMEALSDNTQVADRHHTSPSYRS